MFRSIVCSISIITVVIAATVPEVSKNGAKIIFVDNISKVKDLNQGVKLIPLTRIQGRADTGYVLGSRVSNDRLVVDMSDNFTFPLPQDVRLYIQYPAGGEGAVVTFVEIKVSQSTTDGQAYLESGGIGERSIGILVEAYQTTYFNYAVRIYGI